MNFTEHIKYIQSMSGNFENNTGDCFITPENIEKLPLLLRDCDDIQGILITPYLITKDDNLYELHYYEFELEVSDESKSCYAEYPKSNSLPLEIVENIKPKAIVSKKDKTFFVDALDKYLVAMKRMGFLYDKTSIPDLQDANLFFQIF